MKKLFYMISVAAFMASIASCGKLEQENTPSATTLTIAAALPQTKTFWDQEAEEVKWSNGDVITVLAQGASVKSSTSSGLVSSENFTVEGWPAGVKPLYAVFTAQDNNTYETYRPVLTENGEVQLTLKSNQEIFNRGSFGKVSNVSVGELTEGANGVYTTQMKNICGLIKLQLTSPAYSVTIEDLNGENPLAGSAKIVMENSIPKVVENVKTSTSVTLTSRISGDNGMVPGRTYMACVYPGSFIPKITIKASADDPNPIVFTGKSPVTVTRNEIMDFGTFDNAVDEKADLVLTLDFASWPFDEAGPSSAKASVEGGDVYHKGNYEFVVYTEEGSTYKKGSGYLEANTNPGKFKLKLPAIENRRLTGVQVSVKNTSNGKYVGVLNAGGGTVGSVSGAVAGSSPYTIDMDASKVGVNTNCYISTASGKTQFAKLVLTYTYVEPASAQ